MAMPSRYASGARLRGPNARAVRDPPELICLQADWALDPCPLEILVRRTHGCMRVSVVRESADPRPWWLAHRALERGAQVLDVASSSYQGGRHESVVHVRGIIDIACHEDAAFDHTRTQDVSKAPAMPKGLPFELAGVVWGEAEALGV